MIEEKQETSVLKSISNNLMVQNVDETLNFYTGIGFNIVYKSAKNGVAYWAYIKKDNVELFFQSKESLTKEFPELQSYSNGGALTLWFQVDNISKWYEEVKDKTDVIRPFGITDYNGAKEFVIKDINGFILHFSDFDLKGEINKSEM
ncbi:VOC family protein [Seonamhaeicola sp. ML3]|uniref:VOC family protein n=1 Tax=Seonamhaeicola sp. ML3 TaxID=2937786 RepID=UPI00200CA42C|nr:VOC family protein [Seonamhaeicola sp. ML3]